MKIKNSKSLKIKLLIISIISIINTTHTYAHFLSFENGDEQYKPPRSKTFFYDKNGTNYTRQIIGPVDDYVPNISLNQLIYIITNVSIKTNPNKNIIIDVKELIL